MSAQHKPGFCPIEGSVFHPGVQENPYPFYQELHDLDPVHFDETSGLFLVSKRELIVQAARQPEVFSNEIDMRTEFDGPDSTASDELFEKEGFVVRDVLSQKDPPQHSAYRKIVERLFVGPVANRLETYIEEHVDELIDEFIDDGEVEFFSQFAVPLPLDVIADQLGVSRDDKASFKVWTDAIIETLGIMLSAERKLECTRLIIEFQKYFAAQLADRDDNPREDVLTLIREAELEPTGRQLTIEEQLALIQQLLVAGNETTRNHLAKCVLLLSQKSDVQHQLRSDPTLVKNFIEESLRYESPVQGIFRRVMNETRLGDVTLPKGAKVMFLYGAANRDEDEYDGADQLKPERENAKRHLAFGYGIHACIGAMLARKELTVALTRLLARTKSFGLADDKFEAEHQPNAILRGLKEPLNLVFEKA